MNTDNTFTATGRAVVDGTETRVVLTWEDHPAYPGEAADVDVTIVWRDEDAELRVRWTTSEGTPDEVAVEAAGWWVGDEWGVNPNDWAASVEVVR
mgnify:CR=1 FL=1